MKSRSHLTRTRVKICGFTRAKDALCAANLGVDAIGLVFYESSPRHVSLEQAQAIIAALPPFITVVGLFVNAQRTEIDQVIDQLALDVLQFHGDEDQVFCSSFKLPYIKAVRVQQGSDIIQAAQTFNDAQGLLLDAWHPDIQGGTGLQFDWSLLAQELTEGLTLPLILAGGLNSGNVYTAIETTQPYAVDVSSGVESDKGIKDSLRMENFLKEVDRFGSTRKL
ncbi:MAG: phosphoribosylanthranilate isomerase [Methylococcales bacterium]